MSEQEPSRRPFGRVAFARIRSLTLLGQGLPQEALLASMVPGTAKTLRGRTWRMGQWRLEGQAVVGRIGFERDGLEELWDDGTADFLERTLPKGLTAPFAIDPLSDPMRIAFQIRGHEIRVRSFTLAFEELLNGASPTERWRVEPELRQMPFPQWAHSVDRVVLVRATLERPNPHYHGQHRIEDMVEESRAKMVELALRADLDSPQGLDIAAPIIQEALEHADRNYGRVTVTGERGLEQVQWNSEQQAEAEVRRAPADPATKDVLSVALRHELGDPTAEEEMKAEAQEAIDQIGRDVEEIDLFAEDDEDGVNAA
jgi:hypothetical protein